jgi:DNA polymerase I-like protein with 3'-5' exonuclease and polymerase domains
MLLSYCLAPQTRILRRDLTWVPVETLQPGDELVAFDETDTTVMTPSKVLATKRQTAPCYKITTATGREIIASENHMWVSRRYGQRYRVWCKTKDLARGKSSLSLFAEPWEVDTSYEGGYISGILDGEGHLSAGWSSPPMEVLGNSNWVMGFSQRPGIVTDKALAILAARGFAMSGKQTEGKTATFIFRGYREALRALGIFRPARLMTKADMVWRGKRKHKPVDVVSVEYLGEQEVIGIETDTGTLIAEGYLSHNSLDERPGVHGLKELASAHLGTPDYESDIKRYLKRKADSYEVIPKPVLHRYLAYDCDSTWQLYHELKPRVDKSPALTNAYTNVLIPANTFLQQVEQRGIYINIEALNTLDVEITAEVERVEKAIDEAAAPYWDPELYAQEIGVAKTPEFFNPGSPKQVGWLLYSRNAFGLVPPPKYAANTREDTVQKLKEAGRGPRAAMQFLDLLLESRELHKMKSTYVDGIRERLRHSSDGRIHSTWLLHGTTSGRLASRDPNLQNIPRPGSSKWSVPIRNVFQARKGYVFIEADYSQAELRGLAHLSEDPALIQVYVDGKDLHDEVAEEMFPGWSQLPGGDLKTERRVRAKFVNFGIAYGRGPESIDREFGCGFQEAKRLIDTWFGRFGPAHEYIYSCRRTAARGGTLTSAFGRKRRFHLGAPDKKVQNAAENEGANFPIQSLASDLTLLSAMQINATFKEWGIDGHVVNLVHDSILIECPDDDDDVKARVLDMVLTTMRELPKKHLRMRDGRPTIVPFEADAKIGHQWGSMTKI